jgi:predicted nucleic acid-binding protein
VNLFVDTNVLLAATDPQRERHAAARAFLESGGANLFASPQVMREYLAVATRPPAANGLGLTAHQALENVAEFSKTLSLVFGSAAAWDKLRELLGGPGAPVGKRVHDANIAATAIANGLSVIATFNAPDFAGLAVETLVPSPPAEASEEAITARAGAPTAKAAPVAAGEASTGPRVFGAGPLARLPVESPFFDELPPDELAAWE